jgi:hypothetical protein
MAVNESRVDSLDSRVNTLDERVHEIALKCCGKPQSQCKCSGTCVDAQVHNPGSGGHVDSSGAPCEIQFNGTPFRNRVEGTIYVTLSSRGTNAVGYIHPQTGEDCIVTEGNWKAGDQYPIKIFSEVNGQSTLRISKQP